MILSIDNILNTNQLNNDYIKPWFDLIIYDMEWKII